MRQQHELEMQRIEREHQYRMRLLKEQEEARRRELAATQSAENRQREKDRIEKAHPGWIDTVRTSDFKQWLAIQPESVKNLAASSSATDAILLLDLFKRDSSSATR